MKLISIVKNGKRIDVTKAQLEETLAMLKGGPGSGRYPAGSGKEQAGPERSDRGRGPLIQTPGKGEPYKEPKEKSNEDFRREEADALRDFIKQPIDRAATNGVAVAYNEPTRNLNYKGVEANAGTYLKSAEIIKEYNNFTPEVALEVVNAFGPKATYRMGRESSVVTYVKGGNPLPKEGSYEYEGMKGKMMADELSYEPKTKEVRIWWD